MSTLGLVGGVVTLVLLVALGIYVYPMLLKQRGGKLIIGAGTLILAVVFYLFDRGGFEAPPVWVSAALALLWALAPLLAALIVRRVDRKTRY